MATKHPLSTLLTPESIAIIGASRDIHKIGHIVLSNIIKSGFKGTLYPINSHETSTIENLPVYPSLAALPTVPDLALIAIPAALVLEQIELIAQKGTKNVVIFSAGFKESDEEGKKREEELIALATKHHLNIIGPNCLGFVNTAHGLNATFGEAPRTAGNLRFISQSGAIASSLFDWAEGSGVGFAEFVTLGNKAVLGENDLLDYFQSLPKENPSLSSPGLSTYQPIGLYLESITNGEKFAHLAKSITRHTPLFILKPGKSEAANHAMQSHTGAMANDDAVLEAALEEAGVIRCDGAEDLFDLSRSFAWENAPEGPNIAVVSNAGGPAVVTTDSIATEGLSLASIDQKTHDLLKQRLPRAASVLNPIDVLGDALADRYASAIEAVLAEENVNALLIILTPQIMTQITETAKLIGDLSKKYGKPIFCSFMGGALIAKGEKILNQYRIPSFRFPERAVKALAKMWWWKNWQKTQSPKEKFPKLPLPPTTLLRSNKIITAAQKKAQSNLSGLEAQALLKTWNISTPAMKEVKTLPEARQFAERYGWPLVLKLSSPDLLHKTEAGGVIINIMNTQELGEAFKKMSKKINNPSTVIQIQKQVEKGVELIIGIKYDESFGPVLMFGAGGTLAELLNDRNLLLLPASSQKIQGLIEHSKIFKLLNGFRGEKPYALQELRELIERLVELTKHLAIFKEIEINPVIVTHQKAWAVDGKVLLK